MVKSRKRRAMEQLTVLGGDMGLEAQGAAADSASCQAGGGKAREGAEASGGGRPKEQDDTSKGDGTRKSDGSIGGGRFQHGTRASKSPDGTA